MAATYATNAEVRASYPQIDGMLPATMTQASQSGSSSSLTVFTVPTTNGFPKSGSINVPDSSNAFYNISYDGVTETKFLVTTGQTGLTKVYATGTIVSAAEHMMDHYRALAKSVVDQKITSLQVAAAFKKTLEIMYVFYLACSSHHDPGVRQWGDSVRTQFDAEVKLIVKSNPAVVRQTICKLVEESLDSDEISELKYGPDGDQ